ncbi:MAG: hypothetical protein ABEI06_07090 [Halobacteriaceae archaeon]
MFDQDLEYWFMRWLVDTDQYSGYGSEYPDTLLQLGRWIDANREHKALEETKGHIADEMLGAISRTGTKKYARTEALVEDINDEIETQADLDALAFAMIAVSQISQALKEVPAEDKQYAKQKTQEYLDKWGRDGLEDVLRYWDEVGKIGSLEKEREIIIERTTRIINEIETNKARRISAFLQEFERRLVRGTRPQRAGRSLEDVTGVILDHFDITHTGVPEVLKSGFEVDNLVPCNNSEYIGISCKRTLRERWKQPSNFDTSTLDEYNVREIWHLVTYQADISSSMVHTMGETWGRLYLRDDSSEYKNLFTDADVPAEFVRPLGMFIDDLEGEMRI